MGKPMSPKRQLASESRVRAEAEGLGVAGLKGGRSAAQAVKSEEESQEVCLPVRDEATERHGCLWERSG